MADLALCLQYWEGDRNLALELAMFLAEVESVKNESAVFVLIHRRDAAPPPLTVLQALREKFAGVVVVAGKDLRTGYPDGCNGLWADTIAYLYKQATPEELQGARWALTFEADCVPLRKNWIRELVRKSDANGAPMQGAYQAAFPHLNGNMVVSTAVDVLRRVHAIQLQVPPEVPWDLWSYPHFRAIGTSDAGVVKSGWKTRTAHPSRIDELVENGFDVLHGVKDNSAMRWARSRLGSGPENIASGEVVREGGLHEYPDSTPSCLRQGWPGKVLSWASPRHRQGEWFVQTKNGARCGDLVVFRKQHIHLEKGHGLASRIFVGRLNAAGDVVETGEISGLRKNADLGVEQFDNYEDPRLFQFKGELFMPYVHGAYSNETYLTNQCLAKMSPDGTRVLDHVPLPFGNNHIGRGCIEKNWTFFDDGGQLRAVYSAYPLHLVYDVRTGRRWSSSPAGGAESWKAKYGEPRGGTMPIPFGGRHWITFFHSHTSDVDCGRRYHVGAYLFERASSNYSAVRFTKQPLLTASKQDAFSMPLSFRSVLYNPAVVFPGSAEYVDDGTAIRVTSGLNEHSLVEHVFSVERLKAVFARPA